MPLSCYTDRHLQPEEGSNVSNLEGSRLQVARHIGGSSLHLGPVEAVGVQRVAGPDVGAGIERDGRRTSPGGLARELADGGRGGANGASRKGHESCCADLHGAGSMVIEKMVLDGCPLDGEVLQLLYMLAGIGQSPPLLLVPGPRGAVLEHAVLGKGQYRQ